MATTPLDRLASTIQGILEEYGDDITKNMDEAVKRVGKAGAASLKKSSPGTGQYARKWSYKAEEGRLGTTVTIYSKMPGLPHLLENGHAKRGGGRTAPIVHIRPVEQEIIRDFEEEVERHL